MASQESSYPLSNQPPLQHQSAGDIGIAGNENVTAFVAALGNATIDQSRHIIYNYFYQESKAVSVESTGLADSLPCPYRGLFHFSPADAEFFFGRQVFVDELVRAVQVRSFIPVLGASGSGKSSVVLAGLVPQLQQQGHWQFTHFRPGRDPFHALSLALVPLYTPDLDATDQIAQARRLSTYLQQGEVLLADAIARIQQHYANQRVLLIADQFEELYSLCPEEATRRSFLDCLLSCLSADAVSAPVVLVATMRADFLGNALSYRPFADVLQDGDVKLGGMNRDELCEVIEQPAAKLQVTFEAGLVKRILDAVVDEPGNLPLLEFALTELWGRRNGHQLTHAAYEAIGEVQGALARYADQKYAQLSPQEQAQVRRIFIQLVRPGEGTEDTRRLATKAELGEERWALVHQLANTRLVVTSQDATRQETVEVVHEALIRNWGELRKWITADRAFRTWQERLRTAMQQWQETNHDPGALLRGAPLLEAEDKLKTRRDDLSLSEQAFIQASLDLQQQERCQRSRRRLMTLLGLAGFSTVALGLASVAGWQWRVSERSQINTLIESSKLLLASNHPFDALLPGLRAEKKLQNPLIADHSLKAATAAVLQQAVYSAKEKNRLENFNGRVWDAIFSPDGQMIATSDGEEIRLWRSDGTFLARLDDVPIEPDYAEFVVMGFSQDSQTIATFSHQLGQRKAVKVWNLDGSLRSQFGDNGFITVKFSPDLQTVVTQDRKTAQLLQLDGRLITPLSGSSFRHSSLFSGDSQIIVSTAPSPDPDRQTVKFWQRDGKLISEFVAEKQFYPMALNWDGTIVMMSDGETRYLQRQDGRILAPLAESEMPNHYIRSVIFSPDDQTIAVHYQNQSSSKQGLIKLWHRDGRLRARITGHEQEITQIKFSPDGQRIATASADKTVKIWDLNGKQIADLVGHQDWVRAIDFNPEGNLLISGSDDGTLKLWQINRNSPIQKWNSDRAVFSADKTIFATAINQGAITLHGIDGKPIKTLMQKSDGQADIELSKDGKTIVTHNSNFYGSDSYGPVQLWNGDGKLIDTLIKKPEVSEEEIRVLIRVSRNGQSIVTSILDFYTYGLVQLWNNDGKFINTLVKKTEVPEENNVIALAFLSPDGKTIVTELSTSGSYGPVQLWNNDGKLIQTLIKKSKIPEGRERFLGNVRFSPDGKSILTHPQSLYEPAKLWTTAGEIQATLVEATELNRASSFDVNFSQDGQTLLTIVNDPESHSIVKLWQADGTPIKTLIDEYQIQDSVEAIFSRSDYEIGATADATAVPETIITAIPNGAIQQWHLDGTLRRTMIKQLKDDRPISQLQLSPDGEILAVTFDHKEIQLWQINGKHLKTIAHKGKIGSSSFSPDSQMFASGSQDNSVQLWERSTNSVIPFVGHTSGVSQLHFAPDNTKLATVSEKGRVILYPLNQVIDLQHWSAQACDWMEDYLDNLPEFSNVRESDRQLCED
jgi:WD40 repeat protein